MMLGLSIICMGIKIVFKHRRDIREVKGIPCLGTICECLLMVKLVGSDCNYSDSQAAANYT